MKLHEFFESVCFDPVTDIIILDEEDVCLMYFGFNRIPTPLMFETMLIHSVKSVFFGSHLVIRINDWNLPF